MYTVTCICSLHQLEAYKLATYFPRPKLTFILLELPVSSYYRDISKHDGLPDENLINLSYLFNTLQRLYKKELAVV